MHDLLAQLLQVGFFAALIRIATPLIFATLGELLAERSGVLNLGIEGIMLLSAHDRLHRDLFQRRSLDRRRRGGGDRGGDGPAHGAADRDARPVAACLGPRHHHALHRLRLLFLPPDLRPALPAAERRALPPVPIPAARDIPCHRPGAVQPVRPHLSRLRRRRWSPPCALPHALGPRLRTVGENPRAADAAGVNVAVSATRR